MEVEVLIARRMWLPQRTKSEAALAQFAAPLLAARRGTVKRNTSRGERGKSCGWKIDQAIK